jgi:hypothetical protein
MVKRETIKGIFFNEQFRAAEDQIFWTQIAKKTTLHGIDIALSIVNINNLTTAKNFKLQITAQKNVRNELFSQESTLFLSHYLYSSLRLLYVRIFRFLGL